MTIATSIALIKKDIINLFKKVDTLVTCKEFTPVKNIVYSFVSLVLVAFIGALIALVIR